jgi:hypothetical protein
MPAPGASGALFASQVFADSLAPRINNHGQITFFSELSGPGVTSTNDFGIWFGTPGNLTLPIREGDMLADGSAVTLVGQTSLNDSGVFTMYGYVKPPGVNQEQVALFHAGPGAISVLARPGQPIPGTALNFGDALTGRINNSGQLLLATTYQNSNFTLCRGVPGNFGVVMQQGQIAPGGNGRTFGMVDIDPILFNDSGQVLFHAVLDGTPSWKGLFLSTPTSLTPVVITLQPLPAPNTANLYFDSPDAKADLDSAGDVIFTAPIRFSSSGLWKYNAKTGLKTLIQKNDPIPFMSPRTFQTFQAPKVDSNGQFLVEAHADSGLSGIWGGTTPTNLRLLVSDAGPVPGEPAGVKFNAFGSSKKDFNENGVLVFLSQLSTGAKGLWAADVASGQVEKVLATGESFDVGGGDLRTLKDFNIFDESFLSDANQFAFSASFTDGSTGVFVATVPEPTGIACLLLGAFLAGRRLRPCGAGFQPVLDA